ncbi:alpha/beta hydrolase [Lentzea tibetensis]|uniref:Alpha/beta hydrolase n=2 Tax=Lentzea tibetensis TaxID=2591470 RepID=A0A563F2F0_9PSEU|nr:alpha/beta hydrolase [Lentzea tibetensis]
MIALGAGLAAVVGVLSAATASGAADHGNSRTKPTVVLVHGAFADSSSWNGVVTRLRRDGYPVVAAANPLRGLASDAAYVDATLRTITGPVVLVGHSYGGTVITNAARGNAGVKALVYVAGFAPDNGETPNQIQTRFPGSTLGETLEPIPLGNGAVDLRVRQDSFPQQFAADAPLQDAQLAAVAQRPINAAAFDEPSGAPAWQSIRSYFLIPTGDKSITPAAHQFMAARAKGVTVTVAGASHAVLLSRPDITARLIERAAQETS